MDEQRVVDVERRTKEICLEAGALQTGHFLLASGRHGSRFIDCQHIFSRPTLSDEICDMMARMMRSRSPEVSLVIGPADGARWLVQGVSQHLSFHAPGIRAVIAEKDTHAVKRYAFTVHPRWASIVRGKRVAVVEDIWTSGGSVNAVVDLVRCLGGTVVSVGVIWNRRGRFSPEDYRNVTSSFALAYQELEDYAPGEKTCPGCNEDLPLVKL